MSADHVRQAIVWDTIERLAFKPTKGKDQTTWMAVFERTLHKIWDRQPQDVTITRNSGFVADFLSIGCSYTVDHNKYDIKIFNIDSPTHVHWQLHVDPRYCSKSALCTASGKYKTADFSNHLDNDVQTVLEGMIFHPRNHAHGNTIGIISQLERGNSLSPDKIRLAGGIENGFVFLTHLRYQLCLLSEDLRRLERTRLSQIFITAITERRNSVSAADLFGFK